MLAFESVAEVRSASLVDTVAYWGLRFATSTKKPVEVRRSRGLNLNVSPADRRELIEKLTEALEAYRRHGTRCALHG